MLFVNLLVALIFCFVKLREYIVHTQIKHPYFERVVRKWIKPFIGFSVLLSLGIIASILYDMHLIAQLFSTILLSLVSFSLFCVHFKLHYGSCPKCNKGTHYHSEVNSKGVVCNECLIFWKF